MSVIKYSQAKFYRVRHRFRHEDRIVSEDRKLEGRKLLLTDLQNADHSDLISIDEDKIFIGIDHLTCDKYEEEDEIQCLVEPSEEE